MNDSIVTSETETLLRSIRRWLMAIAFLLGVGLIALADVGYITTTYQDSLLFAIVGVVGGTFALVSGLWLLRDLGGGSEDTREESATD